MLRISWTKTVGTVVQISIFLGVLASASPLWALSPTVALAWDPSADKTVTGYHVYYGTSSRSYTNMLAVGSATNAFVSNLVSGVTYYFAATTYTATGLESDYSAEASYAVPATNPSPATLQASVSVGPSRTLTITSAVGTTCQVQYCTNLAPAAVWTVLTNYTQTNLTQTISVDPKLRQVFYRVQAH